MDPLGTSEEVAVYLRKSPKTLRNWRSLGVGPAWHKTVGTVMYRWCDVERWLDAQKRGGAAA